MFCAVTSPQALNPTAPANLQCASDGVCRCDTQEGAGVKCGFVTAEQGKEDVDCIVDSWRQWLVAPRGKNTTFPVDGPRATTLLHEFLYKHNKQYMVWHSAQPFRE